MRLTGLSPYLWDLLCLGVAQDAEELAGPRPHDRGPASRRRPPAWRERATTPAVLFPGPSRN